MSAKNVALCKALGWRVEPKYVHADVQWYEVYSPSGESMKREIAYSCINDWPEYDLRMVIPDYATDIAAGLAALDATGRDWKLYNYDNSVFNTHYECWHDGYTARGATPAEVCFAALCACYHVEVSSGQ